MLEGSNVVRRGKIDDALRAARAEIVTWNAKDAGIEDLQLCGLRGSPTVVKKRVRAGGPRRKGGAAIELGGQAGGNRRSPDRNHFHQDAGDRSRSHQTRRRILMGDSRDFLRSCK